MCSTSDCNNDNVIFKLTDYDVIGFDFDNTIAQYNLSNVFQLQHSYLTGYLIERKGYNGLSTEMLTRDIDVIRKGLFIDIEKGNVLSISNDGQIIQVSHGFKKLTKTEIVNVYGENMHWHATDRFINDKIITVKSDVIYSFNDYTDIAALSVFMKAIDFIDNTKLYSYRLTWKHLLQAINNMYTPSSELIITVTNKLSDYIYKCDEKLIQWLHNINNAKMKLIIITSATPETLKPIAEYCLGTGWPTLFHTIIDKANKPKFFTERNSFIDSKTNEKLELNSSAGYYRCGNWYDLHNKLSEELGRPAKCLYIGDNVLQDNHGPASVQDVNKLDTISIAEESLAEAIFPGVHPHSEYIRSDFWGSYFWHNDGTPTIMGDTIMKNTKLCLPLLKYFVDKPLDHEYIPFWISRNTGEKNKPLNSNY